MAFTSDNLPRCLTGGGEGLQQGGCGYPLRGGGKVPFPTIPSCPRVVLAAMVPLLSRGVRDSAPGVTIEHKKRVGGG